MPDFSPVASDGRAVSLAAVGSGHTRERFDALWNLGAQSPSTARVGEAHHDAIEILREAGRATEPSRLHAVWAAAGPEPVQLRQGRQGLRLTGTKPWCTAATFAERALVAAEDERGGVLVLIDVQSRGVHPQPPNWTSPAFAALETRSVDLDIAIEPDAIIGVDDWYLNRPGFWHGAIGVAACWAGSITGIVQRLAPAWRHEPHALAHLGAIDAAIWNMRAIINAAADEIDHEPVGDAETRRRRALRLRHLVDTHADDVARRLARALGPGPMAHHASTHRQLTEVDMYRRQSHAERDLETLGTLAAKLAKPHYSPDE